MALVGNGPFTEIGAAFAKGNAPQHMASTVARAALHDLTGGSPYMPEMSGAWGGQNLSSATVPAYQQTGIASPHVKVTGLMIVLKTLLRANEVYGPILGAGGLAPLKQTTEQSIVSRTLQFDKNLPDRRPRRGRASYGGVRTFMSTSEMTSVGLGLEFVYQFLLGPEGPLYLRYSIEQMNNNMTDFLLLMAYDCILTAPDWGDAMWKRKVDTMSVAAAGTTIAELLEKECYLFGAVQKYTNPIETLISYVERESMADSEMKHDAVLMHYDIAAFMRQVPEYQAFFRNGAGAPQQLKTDPEVALSQRVSGYAVNLIKPMVADDEGDNKLLSSIYRYGEFYEFSSGASPAQMASGECYCDAIQIYSQTNDDRWTTITLEQALVESNRWDDEGNVTGFQSGGAYDLFVGSDGTAAQTIRGLYERDDDDPTKDTAGVNSRRLIDIAAAITRAGNGNFVKGMALFPNKPPSTGLFSSAPASRARASTLLSSPSSAATASTQARIGAELIGQWQVPSDPAQPLTLVGAADATLVANKSIAVGAGNALNGQGSTAGARAVMGLYHNMNADLTPEQATGRDALYDALLSVDRTGSKEVVSGRFERFIKSMVTSGAIPADFSKKSFVPHSSERVAAAISAFAQSPEADGVFAQKPESIGVNVDSIAIATAVTSNVTQVLDLPLTLANMKAFVRNRIPLPFSVFLVRPFIQFETHSITACMRGAQNVFFKIPLMTWAPDGHQQTVRGMLSVDVGTHIYLPKTIFRLPHAFISQIIEGFGHSFHQGAAMQPNMRTFGDILVLIEPVDSPLNSNTSVITAHGSFQELYKFRSANLTKEYEGNCFMCREWVKQHYGITLGRGGAKEYSELASVHQDDVPDYICWRGGYNVPIGGTGGSCQWKFVKPSGPLAAAARAHNGRDWYGPGMKAAFKNRMMPPSASQSPVYIQ